MTRRGGPIAAAHGDAPDGAEARRRRALEAATLWRVTGFGRERHPTGERWWFENRARDQAVVVLQFVLGGAILYRDAERRERRVAPGEALLFMHGEPTAYGMPPDATEPLVTEFLALAGAGVREHWALLRSHGSVLPATEAGQALRCQQRLLDHLPQLAGDATAAAAAVHAFVLELLALRRQAHALALTPVERAVEDLLRSPNAALPLKTIAERHGVSREHLTRSFLARMGTPPGAWLARARLERALALLAHTRLPIGEVARQAGYSSTHTLARQVRAATGASPTAARSPTA